MATSFGMRSKEVQEPLSQLVVEAISLYADQLLIRKSERNY
jgi:hypothetical protein